MQAQFSWGGQAKEIQYNNIQYPALQGYSLSGSKYSEDSNRLFYSCLLTVTWPMNGSEAGGDLVLIQTSLLLLCKSNCSNANWVHLHNKSREICIKKSLPSASLPFEGQVTVQRTAKWSITGQGQSVMCILNLNKIRHVPLQGMLAPAQWIHVGFSFHFCFSTGKRHAVMLMYHRM